ncbi:TetR family transcriptional regulator [Micromonospora sp. WMMD1102]|uniref:TetR/AcrR family transcriptional regulator n=1 Tax=Micromonospora sp. WMMD1102 TaxID=3016105 RepID=UPI002414FF90|nr:TetR family transcriptional regulator [Micromonospora sp. WMMD1102]MDG4786669.1 TetR family transcriptional regulator [Micromonospora sp. WMMD1102]
MAKDVEGTKRKIFEAATAEFVAHGPDGITIERIAKRAGVNKERVYNYYGSKSQLFAVVLREQFATTAGAVPLDATDLDAIGEFAGRLYDYSREHPQFVRLLMWEALSHADEVPDEAQRRDTYQRRSAVIEAGQDSGRVTSTFAPDVLHFILLAIAAYWTVMPQVARMITGTSAEHPDEIAQRRADVVAAARRLADPTGP